jgi:hypothetical protein
MQLLLRITGAYLILAGLFNLFEVQLERALLPLVQLGFTATGVDAVSLGVEHGKIVIALLALANSNDGGPAVQTAQTVVQVHAPANTLLVPALILLTGLVAWPIRSVKERLIAACVGFALFALIVMVDLPCAASAAIFEKLAGSHPLDLDFAGFWWFFLDNGGRQLLSIVATLAALLAGMGASKSLSRYG